MDMLEKVEHSMRVFMKMKTEGCRENKGPKDLIAMLHLEYENSQNVITPLHGHPADTLVQIFPHLIEFGKQNDHGNITNMILMTEGYASTAEKDEVPEYVRGEMEKDFKENVDSKVMEVLNVQAVNIETGEQTSGFVSYKYDDNGLPNFNDPEFVKCEGESLNARLPQIFNQCHNFINQYCKEES